MKTTDENEKIKVGDLIEFTLGFYMDHRRTFAVTKIEGENIFINWDCHWFPIQDDDDRKIKVVNPTT